MHTDACLLQRQLQPLPADVRLKNLRPMHSQQQDSRSAMSYRKSSFPDYNVILRYHLSEVLSN